jgi:formate-dependent nitrite reductase membrane component NrfD/mono/diheme cytochrome c family protein
MEPIVLWQHKWSESPYVALYLFFGGLTAGVFIVAALAELAGRKRQRWQRLARLCALTAVPLLALAGLFLTVHLGKPERGLAFPLFFTNYESWMTRGGWIVGTSAVIVVLYAVLWYFEVFPGLRRVLGLVGIPVLAGLSLYTGLLLSGAGYVPLWHRRFLPLLFFNSGLTTGVAAAGLATLLGWRLAGGAGEDPRPVVRGLSLALALLIGVELYELYAFMSHLARGAPVKELSPFAAAPTGAFVAPMGGRLAYELVTRGALAPWFWGGVVGVGLILPLLLTLAEFLLRRWSGLVAGVKFALVVAGGYVLRAVIVAGGDLKAPLPFPPSLWPLPTLPSSGAGELGGALLPFLLAGLTWLNAPAQAAAAASLERGRELYRERCVLCHGEQGQGWDWGRKVARPPVPVPNLAETVPTRDDDFLLSVIKEGGEGVGLTRFMPAFGFQMSDTEVRDVIAYLRTLAGPAEKPP